MFKKKILAAALLTVALALLGLSACSSQPASANAANNVTARQTPMNAQVTGDSVSIPTSQVEKVTNARFNLDTPAGSLSFMAYKYDNQLYVRADICPPCRSKSFTLTKGTLVCDACGTVFSAATGAGIRGACVNFPKQSVPYTNQDGNIVMTKADLTTAYQNTLNPRY